MATSKKHFWISGVLLILASIFGTVLSAYLRLPDFLLQLYYILFALGVSICCLSIPGVEKARISYTGFTAVGAIAIFIFLLLLNPLKDYRNFDVTIFVHGPKGGSDIINVSNSRLSFTIGSEVKTEDIDHSGKATFHNLRNGDKGRISIISAENWVPKFPDSQYAATDKPLYFEVFMKGLDSLFGIVEFQNRPIRGAIVEIKGLSDSTNAFGEFSIKIPTRLQSRTYHLRVLKDGFKEYSDEIHPESEEEIQVQLNK